MVMNIEKEREEFERFAAKNGWSAEKDDDFYRSRSVAWLVRASMRSQVGEGGNKEPFGYFRATPFGWEDCASTDEGAMAPYERP